MVESLLVGQSPARRICWASIGHVPLYVLVFFQLGVVCAYSTAVGSQLPCFKAFNVTVLSVQGYREHSTMRLKP
jgi:hypothetical protein